MRVPFLALLLLSQTVYAADSIVGITKPMHDIELSFPVDGVVSKVLIKEGQKVKKGEELLALENQLQLQEVQRRKVLLGDNSKLQTSAHNKEVMSELLNNNRQLHNYLGAVSREEVRKLEMQTAGVEGDLTAAKQEKKREEIELHMAQRELERRILRSPIDGIITKLDIEQGEWAQPGKMVLHIVDTTKSFLEVNISVDDIYSRDLKQNSSLKIQFKTGVSDIQKMGTVTFISPIVDKSSSLVRVKIEFDNNDGAVLLGMSATVLLPEIKTPKPALNS
ncbi:MAG: efflux RND transporter periplasmic adaptor subunit [Methylococcales bacterium]|nr:efflux RND transporter periplasmic adaptor subunit [Methylococcales bacterium]